MPIADDKPTTPQQTARVFRLIEPISAHVFPLSPNTEMLLGRADDQTIPDIDLSALAFGAESQVSRRHAQLIVRHGLVAVKDLHSTNGTRLNGAPLHPDIPAALQDGDILEFGQVKMIFRST